MEPRDEDYWAHEMVDESPGGRDFRIVHDSHIEVALEPIEGASPPDVFLEQPGALVIRDKETGAEIRFNLGQCIGLVNALTDLWMVSFYG